MPGGAVRMWGRGAFRQCHGQGILTLRGEVATGLLLAHSRGEGMFAVQDNSGKLQSRLTGMYPYVVYRRQSREIWGTGGYGRGRLSRWIWRET